MGLFPTFFMAGFECSTFVWKDGQRKDFVALTGHDRELESDYRRLSELGVGVVREAVRWPLVDQGQGRYDWSPSTPSWTPCAGTTCRPSGTSAITASRTTSIPSTRRTKSAT